jgi:hypothetical protein
LKRRQSGRGPPHGGDLRQAAGAGAPRTSGSFCRPIAAAWLVVPYSITSVASRLCPELSSRRCRPSFNLDRLAQMFAAGKPNAFRLLMDGNIVGLTLDVDPDGALYGHFGLRFFWLRLSILGGDSDLGRLSPGAGIIIVGAPRAANALPGAAGQRRSSRRVTATTHDSPRPEPRCRIMHKPHPKCGGRRFPVPKLRMGARAFTFMTVRIWRPDLGFQPRLCDHARPLRMHSAIGPQ